MKRVLIIGSAGQDGRILWDRLVREGDVVVGVTRDATRTSGIAPMPAVSVLDRESVAACVRELVPDEVYYLAAVHHASQEQAGGEAQLLHASMAVHVTGLLHVLEAMALHAPAAKLFYAASSHIFGQPEQSPQNEQTPLAPICPYGITKAAGVHICRCFRRDCAVAAYVGILYNHESIYRSPRFVSMKIIHAAHAIRRGRQERLVLGSLSDEVDWGYAPDYVDAMIRMLRHAPPEDYVVATGRTHRVDRFVEAAFAALGLDPRRHVVEDSSLIRKPRRALRGDAAKLRAATGWTPSLGFDDMVRQLTLDPHFAGQNP
ncbi:MAG: GDP-mannose 4,6-dehydratase [Phycisphaeraceae bacterium]|nr:GDP-mannose 4,6-dehydratase [Phycisphaeraceae bacterium]